MDYSIPLLDLFLIAGRMTGMIFTAPIFGSRNYPIPMKIGLIFFTTLLIFPFVASDVLYDVSTFLGFAALLFNEVMIGIFIGLIVSIFFNFIYFAGDIIDHELGFSIVSVINPLDESQIPITANLFYVFSTMIFLQLDLHHELIAALVYSFKMIHLGSSFFAVNTVPLLLDLVQASFITGFQIAAPFAIAVFIANLILGLLAKAMPGMNIFILGMPFKIFFGFLLFIILMPYMYQIFSDILNSIFDYVQRYFFMYDSLNIFIKV